MRLQVLDKPWYEEGLQFTCTECGNCCTGGPGYVWISEVEIERLAAHLGLTRQETLKQHCRRIGGRISLKENRNAQGNYDCVFLREVPAEGQEPGGEGVVVQAKRICTIYAVRPLQCRTWPFWEGNLSSESNWRRAAGRCPGMNRGRRYTREEMEALRDAADWPARPPGSDKPG